MDGAAPTFNESNLDHAISSMLSARPGVSDINFTVGKGPQVELHGELVELDTGDFPVPLRAGTTEMIADLILGRSNPDWREAMEATGAADSSFELYDGTRLRVNVFKARGDLSVVLRVLASRVPSLDKLQLPPILEEIPPLRNGLVLVTGGTGSGKSTTLAALIDRMNATRAAHIVTLEDPVEFLHSHRRATINQRELGQDFASFGDGLRSALRQAPKVILVGEMRDPETLEIGLKAAETGHLVLSTLHTIDAGQTIGRIIGMFEPEQRGLVRSRLAEVLRFVVGQRLLPRQGGGRVAALEIMGSSMRVRDLIQSGETVDRTFADVIAEAAPHGWQTFDQHIVKLFADGVITEEVARSFGSDPATIGRGIDRVLNERGQNTSSIGHLEMANTNLK